MVVYYIGLPLLLLAAVIDSSVLTLARYLNGQPSLVLILVVAWGLLNDLPDALVWAILGGIFADVLSILPTGTSSLGYVLVVTMLSVIFGRVGRRNVILPPLAGSLATVIYQSVILAMLAGIGRSVPLDQALVTWMLPSAIFNAVGVLIVTRMMGSVLEFFRPPVAGL